METFAVTGVKEISAAINPVTLAVTVGHGTEGVQLQVIA